VRFLASAQIEIPEDITELSEVRRWIDERLPVVLGGWTIVDRDEVESVRDLESVALAQEMGYDTRKAATL
jgi:hypothetical protein